jgi:type I restriction enzyme S subunit
MTKPPPGWRDILLGEVVTLQRGFDITKVEQSEGPYPVISSSGPTSTHASYKVRGPGIVIGRKGTLGGVYYSQGDFWPHDTTLWVKDFHGNDPRFVYYWMQTLGLRNYDVGASNPTLNRNHLHLLPTSVPDAPTQRKIAAVLSAYDSLIENNGRRITILEEMAQGIYREWFVDFRYPGHENIPLVGSTLGPIPAGWAVRTIAEVAAREPYAVTSGPFGSKLGRKDYIAEGVPVIRGTNLALGGGFRDSDFVFVSSEKAEDIKSCLARPGDIVVTQRGTLGQVGLIPASAKFARYVLSQSQMRITVDPTQGSNQYLYAALRSPEVTRRLQDHAMTAGVPHINLSIFREFPVVWPDDAVQAAVAQTFGLLERQVVGLTRAVERARASRDLLLPRLISGEVDVVDLDIATPEAAA